MLEAWQHRTGIAVAVTGIQLTSSFGSGATVAVAYVLAAILGLVLVVQGERRSVSGSITANTIVGYTAGTVACVLLVAALMMTLLDVPWDLALWSSLLQNIGPWLGVGGVVLSAFFLGGLATAIR